MVDVLFVGILLGELAIGALVALSFQLLAEAHWLAAQAPAHRGLLRLTAILPLVFLIVFVGRSAVYPWGAQGASAAVTLPQLFGLRLWRGFSLRLRFLRFAI